MSKYYAGEDGKQLWDRFEEGLLTREQTEGFYVGCIIKYIVRFKNKNGLEDLDKAVDYAKRLRKFEAKFEQIEVTKEKATPWKPTVKHLVILPNGQYVSKAEAGTYQIFSDDPQNYDKLTKEEVYEAEKQLHLTGLVELWKKAGKQEVKNEN